MKPNFQIQFLLLTPLIFLFTINTAYSQETEFKNSSIRTGIGIGLNQGKREDGVGLVYSIGWQKSFGEKSKFRLNPNMSIGGFSPVIITGLRDQFYRITLLGINIHYDLIRYKAISLVTTGGGFMNYSRGLLGTGGRPANRWSEYFNTAYFGGTGSVGFRFNPAKSNLAFEVRPINIHLGNKEFLLGYIMGGIDFKLRNSKRSTNL